MAGLWRTLYEQMLQDMASSTFRRMGSYAVAGQTMSYRSLDEFRRLLAWVGVKADLEEGRAPYNARVAVANGGRGWRGGRGCRR